MFSGKLFGSRKSGADPIWKTSEGESSSEKTQGRTAYGTGADYAILFFGKNMGNAMETMGSL